MDRQAYIRGCVFGLVKESQNISLGEYAPESWKNFAENQMRKIEATQYREPPIAARRYAAASNDPVLRESEGYRRQQESAAARAAVPGYRPTGYEQAMTTNSFPDMYKQWRKDRLLKGRLRPEYKTVVPPSLGLNKR